MRGRCSPISSPRGIESGRRCDSGQNSPSTLHHREQEHCRKVHQAPSRASAATRTAAPYRTAATCAHDRLATPPPSRCSATISHQHSTFWALLWTTARAFHDGPGVLLTASAAAPGLGAMGRRVPRVRRVAGWVANEPIRVRADLRVPQMASERKVGSAYGHIRRFVHAARTPFYHPQTPSAMRPPASWPLSSRRPPNSSVGAENCPGAARRGPYRGTRGAARSHYHCSTRE